MKRLLLFVFIAAIIIGCCQQELPNVAVASKGLDTSKVEIVSTSSDSVLYYFSQAKLGIGDAYVKMAHYYRDGTLGKPNLLMTIQMGEMAKEYMAIPNIDALFKDVPDDDVTRISYETIKYINLTDNVDTLMVKAEELISCGIPDGYFMQALVAYKQRDKEKAMIFCEKGTEAGSLLAAIMKDMLLCVEKYGVKFENDFLLKVADRFPLAYRLLGDYYAEVPNDSAKDIPLAMQYYIKASDHACLGRQGALWVLDAIYTKGYPTVDSTIIDRLWSLGRNEINDSVMWLP